MVDLNYGSDVDLRCEHAIQYKRSESNANSPFHFPFYSNDSSGEPFDDDRDDNDHRPTAQAGRGVNNKLNQTDSDASESKRKRRVHTDDTVTAVTVRSESVPGLLLTTGR